MHSQRRISFGCWVLCALASAALGCSEEENPATALIVSVKSDLEDLAEIELAVFESDADPSRDAPDEERLVNASANLSDLPLSFAISRGKASEIMIAVRALDARGFRLAEVRTRARFSGGKSLAVPMFLGAVCRGQLCDQTGGETCYVEAADGVRAGQCGPIPTLRASDLEEIEKPGDEHDWAEPEPAAPGSDARPDASPDGGPDTGADSSTCSVVAGGTCGLLPQCGCAEGQACRLTGSGTTACGSMGTTAPDAACATNDECPAGYGCIDFRCAAYCGTDEDCGAGGACVYAGAGTDQVSPVGACLVPCDAAASEPCAPGAVCADFTDAAFQGRTLVGSFCWTPAAPCPFEANGVCDGPTGTRLCAEGTDVEDCATCTPATPVGGACDLLDQCGCEAGQTCQHSFETGSLGVACRDQGSVAAEGLCGSPADCGIGQTCTQGVCRKYCTTINDCEPGSTCIEWEGGVNVCYVTCDVLDQSTCSPGTACVQYNDFCIAPERPCSYAGDGECDEPEGTHWCAEGTDTLDCCPVVTPAPPPTACDLVSQCGCPQGQSCVDTISGPTLTKTCAVPGTKKTGEVCTATSECSAGHGCIGNLCKPYCNTDAECASQGMLGGRCLDVVWGAEPIVGLKTCVMNCDPLNQQPCGTGTVCPRDLNPFCWFPLPACEGAQSNGRCDEPEGTRFCAEGSDPVDCGTAAPQ